MLQRVLPLLPVLLAGEPQGQDLGRSLAEETLTPAFEGDDACPAADDDCHVSLRQLRGLQLGRIESEERLDADYWHGSCEAYGCSHDYVRHLRCQCNPGCKKYSNCCKDYEDKCISKEAGEETENSTVATPYSVTGSCKNYGCSHTYSRYMECQCNMRCSHFGNCCSDYESTCEAIHKEETTPPDAAELPPSPPTPVWMEPSDAGAKAEAVDCSVSGVYYVEPSGSTHMSGTRRTKEDSLEDCQAQCAKQVGCGHFAYWGDGGCLLTSIGGEAKHYHGHHSVKSGPPSCSTGSIEGVLGHPSTSQYYPQYPGFSLFLAEEFDEPLDLDNDPVWTWSDGGLAEGQTRFVKEQVKFEDGKMKIVAEPNPGIQVQNCSRASSMVFWEMPMVSAEMRTRFNWFRYGRYEVRLKTPSVQPGNPKINGNYISTMFIYRDANFHHWREIDFEITGDTGHAVTTNMIYADYAPRWTPRIQHSLHLRTEENTREEFHTYAFEWLPDGITWYIDDKVVRRIKKGKLPIPDKSAKIMMNLWIFGEHAYFGGREIKNNQYPLESEYDWVRFYKWNDDQDYPCSGLSTTCLADEDYFLSGNNPCDGQDQNGYKDGQPVCQPTCNK